MLTYREALLAIFRRADYERGDRPPYPERVWRLSRVEELLHAIGDPHRAYPSVHVAGTKGKGSTTAMIESALRAARLHTGMYTSPHLHTFRERVRLDGQPISEAEVVRQMEALMPVLASRHEVTVFEIITALGMRCFADARVDWAVFEVGMGGRLDATNVIRPEVAVITSISLDHMQVLGNTIAAIAGEKAGIIKEGVPVVTSPQRPEAMNVIVRTARERHAPLVVSGRDWRWRLLGYRGERQQLKVWRRGNSRSPEYPRLDLPLLGAHQLENACTAVAALETLRDTGHDIPREAVIQGLARVEWPGRLEVLGHEPLVVVDGAHNVYSMERLIEAVDAYLPHRRLIVVFGVGVTHAPDDLMLAILPHADVFIATQSHHPKATPAQRLADIAREHGRDVDACSTAAQALDAALAEAQPEDLILFTGSLFVVAEAREAWAASRGLPPLPADPPDVY